MFEQAFKNIDDILFKEAGCVGELDYIEQTSWLLFLRYLDDLENEKAEIAKLKGKEYKFLIEKPYRWSSWAVPKKEDGSVDHNRSLTGKDLLNFVNGKLFPYFQSFRDKADKADTIEYKIAEIFGEIKNKLSSGYSLRDVLNVIDELRFRSQKEKHELSHLYGDKVRKMGNAGRNGGEYYTPRPLIRAMIRVIAPKIGETIYDGACGSAGFLCEAYDYMRHGKKMPATSQLKKLQKKTFYGKEKKSLAYIIGTMNMILHGIEAPNIIHTNTLTENLADIQEKDRFDIILANPPFGGKERKEIQQNFPIKTGETAFLFLQHFIKSLKAGGRAAVVIKNTFLSNSDNASKALRKELLENCNLHTVLDCPGGTFLGAGVKTVVLFFEKGAPTRKIWFYQLDPSRSLGRTNPLNDDDLAEFVELQKTFADSERSWTVDAGNVDQNTFDLSVKNPNMPEETPPRHPQEILAEIKLLNGETNKILKSMEKPARVFPTPESARDGVLDGWSNHALEELATISAGNSAPQDKALFQGGTYPFIRTADVGRIRFGQIKFTTDYLNDAGIKKLRCFPKGTILFPKSGASTFLNHRVIMEIDGYVASHLATIQVDRKKIHPWFLLYFLHTVKAQDLVQDHSYPSLNLPLIKSISVPVPPLSEQKRIVSLLDKLSTAQQSLIGIYETKLNALSELKRSILNQAFNGKL